MANYGEKVTCRAGLETNYIVNDSALMFRNKIINGSFDIWQRGASQTSSGYGSNDRFLDLHNGSTKTHTREIVTLGDSVIGQFKYYSKTVVTSSAGAGNYALKQTALEGVKTLQNKTATLSFYAKADATKNIAVELVQGFGGGGSPSSAVFIAPVTVALTTSWVRYTATFTVPSISGKTLGTDGKDYLGLNIWFDAGSSFNARTNTLGQQSGTFELAGIQLEEGSVATPFELRPVEVELALCQRYYERSYGVDTGSPSNTTEGASMVEMLGDGTNTRFKVYNCAFKVTKRSNAPTIKAYSQDATADTISKYNDSASRLTVTSFTGTNDRVVCNYLTTSASGIAAMTYFLHWTAEAEL